jgi:hypothetical protein
MISKEFLYDCAYRKSAENPILSDTPAGQLRRPGSSTCAAALRFRVGLSVLPARDVEIEALASLRRPFEV